MEVWLVGWLDRQMDGSIYGWIDGQVDVWINLWMYVRMYGCKDECMSVLRYRWMEVGMQGWIDGWGIFFVLEEVRKKGFLYRVGQEVGGECDGDVVVCFGCIGSKRLYQMVYFDEIGNVFVM